MLHNVQRKREEGHERGEKGNYHKKRKKERKRINNLEMSPQLGWKSLVLP